MAMHYYFFLYPSYSFQMVVTNKWNQPFQITLFFLIADNSTVVDHNTLSIFSTPEDRKRRTLFRRYWKSLFTLVTLWSCKDMPACIYLLLFKYYKTFARFHCFLLYKQRYLCVNQIKVFCAHVSFFVASTVGSNMRNVSLSYKKTSCAVNECLYHALCFMLITTLWSQQALKLMKTQVNKWMNEELFWQKKQSTNSYSCVVKSNMSSSSSTHSCLPPKKVIFSVKETSGVNRQLCPVHFFFLIIEASATEQLLILFNHVNIIFE